MTEHTSTVGNFTSLAYFPYVLTPNYETHNSYGFRGKEFEIKPHRKRIVCVGSSTTFGIYVDSDKTYSAQLENLLNEGAHEFEFEVLNAGIPGWVSTENLLNLQLRILPLQPDLVIIYQGRNEIFPQSFNNFASDYSHYRKADYSFKATNYLYKPLFKFSNLFMIFATYRGSRFGWSWTDENPAYGNTRFENQPTATQVIENLDDPSRNRVYRSSVASMVAICKSRNIDIILCTMAFQADRLATGNLENDPIIYESLQKQVNENNQIVREIANKFGVPVAETASLMNEPELFLDDCHFNEKGHARRAAIIYQTIVESKLFQSGLKKND